MQVRTANLMLTGARVTQPFRDELFRAADEAGRSVTDFVIEAAAEKLIRHGAALPGVFRAGDLGGADYAR